MLLQSSFNVERNIWGIIETRKNSFWKDCLILFQSKEDKVSNILNHKRMLNKGLSIDFIKLEQGFNGIKLINNKYIS